MGTKPLHQVFPAMTFVPRDRDKHVPAHFVVSLSSRGFCAATVGWHTTLAEAKAAFAKAIAGTPVNRLGRSQVVLDLTVPLAASVATKLDTRPVHEEG